MLEMTLYMINANILAKFISQPTTKNVDKMLGQGQKCRNPYFEQKCST